MNTAKTIVYVGDTSPGRTSFHRMNALKALGHVVININQYAVLEGTWARLMVKVMSRLGYPLDSAKINAQILEKLDAEHIDILWLDKPLTVIPATLQAVKEKMPWTQIVAYSPDDMLNPRNQSRYHQACLPLIDVYFTTKSFHVEELRDKGCSSVFFVPNAYDKNSHKPVALSPEERSRWGGRVGFIGGYEVERFNSLLYLACANVPIRIRGSFWERVPTRHPNLQIEIGDLGDYNYAKAITATDINLCFLRKVNRDLQTTRSIEIPACGGFMLAERTDEHLALFEEGKEAEFFSSNDEMLGKINYFLANPDKRQRIAEAGRKRCIDSGYSNEDRLKVLLDLLGNNACSLKKR